MLLLLLCLLLSPSPSLQQQNQDSQGSAGSCNQEKPEVKVPGIHCSRERSRAAAKVIDEVLQDISCVMPFVEKENYQLPNKCLLQPEGNLYKDQEDHKVHVDIHEWRCGYCRKTFYKEKISDNRHFDLVNAIYVELCIVTWSRILQQRRVSEIRQRQPKIDTPVSLADCCFPVQGGPSANRLHEFFLHQFCDAHTCPVRQKPFSRGRRKRRSISYIVVCVLILMLLPLCLLLCLPLSEKRHAGPETHLAQCSEEEALLILQS